MVDEEVSEQCGSGVNPACTAVSFPLIQISQDLSICQRSGLSMLRAYAAIADITPRRRQGHYRVIAGRLVLGRQWKPSVRGLQLPVPSQRDLIAKLPIWWQGLLGLRCALTHPSDYSLLDGTLDFIRSPQAPLVQSM